MGHDEHFLSRVDRLNSEHAELALSLYRDHILVNYLLDQVELPPAAERVALSLSDAEDGPFVIVSRDGHFVTCLGEGMQLQPGQPVVPRHRLDLLSERILDLRQLMEDAKTGQRKQSKHLLRRVMSAGDRLSREEFQAVARWLPLCTVQFTRSLMLSAEIVQSSFQRLALAKRLGRRSERFLEIYWRSSWALSHLTLLLGSDNGEHYGRLLATLTPEQRHVEGVLLPWELCRLGVTNFAARGAWIASKLPKFLFGPVKEEYQKADMLYQVEAFGLSLSGIALRHKRYQAEIHKLLSQIPEADNPYDQMLGKVRALLLKAHECALGEPNEFRQSSLELSRSVLKEFYEHRNGEHGDPEFEALAHAPDDVAIAFLLSVPLDLHGRPYGFAQLVQFLPWIAHMEADQFYIPEACMAPLRKRWTWQEGEDLIKPRLEEERPYFKPAPKTVPPVPSRNAPCSCGSGKKYKKCCFGKEASN